MSSHEDVQSGTFKFSVSGTVALAVGGAHAGLPVPWLLALLGGHLFLLAGAAVVVYWLVPLLAGNARQRGVNA